MDTPNLQEMSMLWSCRGSLSCQRNLVTHTSVTATAETAASQNNDQDHTTEDTFVGGKAECFHAIIVEEHTTLIL